jgi:hypothetical protein
MLVAVALAGFGQAGVLALAAEATDVKQKASDYEADFKTYDSNGNGFIDAWITARVKTRLLKDVLLTGMEINHGDQRGNPRQGGAIGRFS